MEQFEKKKEYLICIDSDGCAMDTMDIKHIRCFGPCMIKEWELQKWEGELLKRWNEINLYTMTRGINRFKGLAKMLREVNDTYQSIEGIEVLEDWVKKTDELSNGELSMVAESNPCLQKALEWSLAVNRNIAVLPDDLKHPFLGVKEGIIEAHQIADVAIVSSANRTAVEDEWAACGFLDYVDVIMAQDSGSKARCIEMLSEKGYDREKILMVGDAPGDREAARENGTCFYPILVRHEKESWERFQKEAIKNFIEGKYQGAYEDMLNQEFEENLAD